MNYLVLTGLILGISFFAPILAKWIDSLLDYGKIFGIVRFKIAEYHANDKLWFTDITNKIKENKGLDFSDRLTEMDRVYWEIAKDSFWFTLFLCVNCMTTWAVIFLSLSTLYFFPFYYYPFVFLISAPLADYILSKL